MTEKTQVSSDTTTKATKKTKSVEEIVILVRKGEKVSMEELERIRKEGHTELWIRHELEHGRKVSVEVDMDDGEDIMNDEHGNEVFPQELVFINGIRIKIPKGVQVEVSYLVADILSDYKKHRRTKRQRSLNLSRPEVVIG